MRTKQIGSCVAAALALLASGAAMADPVIVTQWGYTTSAIFTAGTFETGDGVNDGVTIVDDYELSWGRSPTLNPAGNFLIQRDDSLLNRSALTIGAGDGIDNSDPTQPDLTELYGGGAVTGVVNTTIGATPDFLLGQIVPGITITHWNNILDGRRVTLTGGTIRDTLTLFPLAPVPPGVADGSLPVPLPTLTFDFTFQETPNAGDPQTGLCADGNAASSYPGGCPDLFGLVGDVTLDQPFFFPVGPDEVKYFASIFLLGPAGSPTPIGTLEDDECAAINLPTGCQGFRTFEEARTTAEFFFAITTEPLDFGVPEPGTLALLGLGLAGLGFSSRRRKA